MKSRKCTPRGTGPLPAAAATGVPGPSRPAALRDLPPRAEPGASASVAREPAGADRPSATRHATSRELAFCPSGPTYAVYLVPDEACRRTDFQPSGSKGSCAGAPRRSGADAGVTAELEAPDDAAGLEVEPT